MILNVLRKSVDWALTCSVSFVFAINFAEEVTSWISISSFKEALETCKEFLTSVKGWVFYEKPESECCGETDSS